MEEDNGKGRRAMGRGGGQWEGEAVMGRGEGHKVICVCNTHCIQNQMVWGQANNFA